MHTFAHQRILVTGHCGLIGTALDAELRAQGYEVRGLDIRATGIERGDLRDRALLERAMHDCDGIVHLGAVSRVIDGERDPDACWSVNADGTQQLIETAQRQNSQPWILYASSREVYGEIARLPASEDTPCAPVNIYGRSKVAGECAVRESRLQSAIVRFSNVYGSTHDHRDRVIPAFCRQSVHDEAIRVDGYGHTFDFTHLDDVVRGLLRLIGELQRGQSGLTLHFASGVPTTLGQLAELVVELADSSSEIYEAPSRDFDVGRFYGDPARAKRLLGWEAEVPLSEGLDRLIAAFRAQRFATAGIIAQSPNPPLSPVDSRCG